MSATKADLFVRSARVESCLKLRLPLGRFVPLTFLRKQRRSFSSYSGKARQVASFGRFNQIRIAAANLRPLQEVADLARPLGRQLPLRSPKRGTDHPARTASCDDDDDSGNDWYSPKYKPPRVVRKPVPGERLWEVRKNHITSSAELRFHGESYGWEALIRRDGDMTISRRFVLREQAMLMGG